MAIKPDEQLKELNRLTSTQLTADKGEDQHKNGAMDQTADKLLINVFILACSVLVSVIIDLMFFIFYFKVAYCKFNIRFRVQDCVEYFKATDPKHNKHITTCGILIDRSGSSITGVFFKYEI